jgi:outer membrane receptor protein involved in Fe transport
MSLVVQDVTARKRGLLCGAAAAVVGLATPVFAGDEILVTGERRPQLARDATASLDLIDEDELRRLSADHASEALARAPGVLIHRGSGQEHLTAIRSPVLTGGAGAGSFLFLENGVPLRSAGFANVNALFEAHTEIASAIEVLRGPSGALYGANAIHGVVNVLTPTPPTADDEDFAAVLSFSGDTVERYKGSAIASDAIGGQGFSAGLSLVSERGYRDATGLDQQKATLRHLFSGDGVTVDTILSGINLNQETGGFLVGQGAYRDPVLRRRNANPEAFRDARAVRLQSRIGIEAGEDVSISITPFARWTDQAFLLHFFPSKALEKNAHWSAGLQSAVYLEERKNWSFIVGADGEYTEGSLSEVQSIPSIGSFTQGVHYDYEVAALSISPFAQARHALTDRLDAVVAARLDWTRFDYDNRTATGTVGRFLRPADAVDSFVTVSPKASLLYDIGEGTLRASYARGARPPQTADLYRLQPSQTSNAATSEFIDAVEIGWRGAVGRRIDLDAAAYFMAKRNFFFRDADGLNVNDGKTRHVGFEIDAAFRAADWLTLDANAAYGRHSYRFDRPVSSAPQRTEAIRSGDIVDTAPKWLAGARALVRPTGSVSGEIEWGLVGRYFTDAANSQTYPGHHLVHFRLGLDLNDQAHLTVVVRNLFDKLYAERADFAFGEARYFPGEERTISVGFRASL